MRRILSIAIVACAVWGVFSAPHTASLPQEEEEENKIINLKADLSGPVAPGDSVIFLVGNFAAQHNGAVITCDSAVRYSADRMEFFGNVLINQNTTYIYGERAEYNRLLNEARVYSDLIKVVDGDATLYTYEFAFNTKDNIGIFGGGGMLVNRDNLMEADHGYYYADTKELICVDSVEMRNDEYQMTGDSVVYNLATDHAFYFENTNIWNTDGDYLFADRGEYEKADTLYKVTLNGYILTEKQELWSDSIDYYRAREHAVLRRAVQIDDTEHKTLAFGDYGEYWKDPGDALLTRRPAVVNYDPEQGDSLFMRADTMFLYTILPGIAGGTEIAEPDSLAEGELPLLPADSLAEQSLPGTSDLFFPHSERTDTLSSREGARTEGRRLPRNAGDLMNVVSQPPGVPASDSLAAETLPAVDSLAQAENAEPELSAAERKAKLREAARQAKAEQKAIRAAERKARLDSIGEQRQAKATAKLLAQEEKEQRRLEQRRTKAETKLRLRQAKALRKGKELPDSTMLSTLDSMLADNAQRQDSLSTALVDTLAADSTALAGVVDSLDSLGSADSLPAETMYRLIKAYRNVRTFRSDFQSVCDSLVAISRDSTIHLYINPVLWNEENQITSDVMDIFTRNQQIVRAEFVGQPMMVSQIDTVYYNQVAGKEMTAYFTQNRIYRNDVNGNAQTIYYMQESDSPAVKGLMVIESGNISFYINADNRIYRITYRNDVNWTAYPMDKIPPDLELFLKGFKWEAARRPVQADVFDRPIRPSQRAEREALPLPAFPIAVRIEADKKRFAEERGWADRNDLVPPGVDEWMRSLGYTTGQPRKDGLKF